MTCLTASRASCLSSGLMPSLHRVKSRYFRAWTTQSCRLLASTEFTSPGSPSETRTSASALGHSSLTLREIRRPPLEISTRTLFISLLAWARTLMESPMTISALATILPASSSLGAISPTKPCIVRLGTWTLVAVSNSRHASP